MTEIPRFSPGCFGSALAFRANDPICQNCPFSVECEMLHIENRKALQDRFGLAPIRPRKNTDSATGVAGLPKKVGELVEKIRKCGIQMSRLARGENPFDKGGMPFMRVACHLLLHYHGRLDREILTTAFVTKLNWKEGTAEAHARMTIQALTYFGVVDNQEGRIMLRCG